MRVTPRPLNVRECAEYLGFTTEWIRRAITHGVEVDGATVMLGAERLELKGRVHYRIHEDTFRAFLHAIGWKRIAKRRAEDRRAPASHAHQ